MYEPVPKNVLKLTDEHIRLINETFGREAFLRLEMLPDGVKDAFDFYMNAGRVNLHNDGWLGFSADIEDNDIWSNESWYMTEEEKEKCVEANRVTHVKTDPTPFIGFSNETLDTLPAVDVGDEVHCPHCNGRHQLSTPDSGNSLLLFYKCDRTDKSYLAAINGRLIAHVKPDVSGSI